MALPSSSESAAPSSSGSEIEPFFKFETLQGEAARVLVDRSASCLLVHSRFLALGSGSGTTTVMDFVGTPVRSYAFHKRVVTDLSCDENGEFLGSCSLDQNVVIQELYGDQNFRILCPSPIQCLSLDPFFGKKSSRRFLVGLCDGRLLLYAKKWLSFKETLLREKEGSIPVVKWSSNYAAYANAAGVRVLDIELGGEEVGWMERSSTCSSIDQLRPSIVWSRPEEVIVSWGNLIEISAVVEAGSTGVSLPIAPSDSSRKATSHSLHRLVQIRTPLLLCGVAPMGTNLVVMLYEGITSGSLPRMALMATSGSISSSDQMTGCIRFSETMKAENYVLECYPSDTTFYVRTPRQIITVRPRDQCDHIKWLCDHGKVEEALGVAEKCSMPPLEDKYSVAAIGEQFLQELMTKKNFEKAAANLVRVVRDRADAWTSWMENFRKSDCVQLILDLIPLGEPLLARAAYEGVLLHLLERDPSTLYSLVSRWPPAVYDVKEIQKQVNKRRSTAPSGDPSLPFLTRVAAHLLELQGKYQEAFELLLTLLNPTVFDFIREKKLYAAAASRIDVLIQIDRARALAMLIEHVEEIKIPTVVEGLRKTRPVLHEYLHALFLKDTKIASDFHPLQIRLYAEYDPSRLMRFLQTSNFFPLQEAHDVCEEFHLDRERVFILKRMGNQKEALALLMKIGTVKEAVEFVEESKEDDLWDDVVQHCTKSGVAMGELLDHIGWNVDIIELIKKIPSEIEVPLLRDRLARIVGDYSVQIALERGSLHVHLADCVSLLRRLHAMQTRGRSVDVSKDRCPICESPLGAGVKKGSLVVFGCGHVYHRVCLTNTLSKPADSSSAKGDGDHSLRCVICSKEKSLMGVSAVASTGSRDTEE